MADNHVMLRCSHCGTTAKYATPADFKFAVPEYLDGRPFEKDGFSIKNAVMCCPKCGYASFNVSKNILTDSRIISRDEYEDIIKSNFLPKYINNYIAIGYIYENQNEHYNAAHAYLCAAWGCMDEGKKQESFILLENAAKLMLKHIGSEEFKAHPDLTKIQYAVDVLRQMRQFENAKKLAAYALRRDLPEKLRTIFLLEESLCDNYISKPHAYVPEKDTTIMSFDDLFRRFAESVNLDDKEKLRVYKEAFDFVNTVKKAEITAGVDLLYNPVYNRSFDFNKAVDTFRKYCENKGNVEVREEVEPKVYAPKVLTKIDDVLPEKKEEELAPQEEVQPIEEDIQPVEEFASQTFEDYKELEQEFSNRVFVRESAPIIFEEKSEVVDDVEEIAAEIEEESEEVYLNEYEQEETPDNEFAQEETPDLETEVVEEEQQPLIEEVVQQQTETFEEEFVEEKQIEESFDKYAVEESLEEETVELTEENVDEVEKLETTEENIESVEEIAEQPVEEIVEKIEEIADEDEEENEDEDEDFDDDDEDLGEDEFEEEDEEEIENEDFENSDFGLSYEQLKDTVLTVSEIDGIISISEVQALFEYGYMQAKNLLEKMVEEGLLSHGDNGQVYGFIKKA